MALLAGIDEAGYGPHLGPLVVAAAALRFPGRDLPDPDLWPALADHVHKRPGGAGGRAVVCDSKAAYTGGGAGLARLERTVLGFLAAGGVRPRSFADLLEALSPGPAAHAGHADPEDRQPWHRPEDVPLPAAATADEVDAAAARLAAGLASIGASGGRLWVNTAPPARLNRLMNEGGRNKAQALFALNADLLVAIRGAEPDAPVHVTVDRHGGRRYYGGLLAGAFPMDAVEVLGESPAESRYRLRPSGAGPDAAMDITVRDRCEAWSLVTALASMAAKYVRELDMGLLNAYFAARVPDLRPTAGYGRDAWRFLAEVAAARSADGVPDAAILRSR